MSDILLPEIAEKLRRAAWYILTHSYARELQLAHAEVLADLIYFVIERENKEDGFILGHRPAYVSYFAGWACIQRYRREYRNYRRLIYPLFDELDTTLADLPQAFTAEVIDQLTEPARSFVQHIIDLDRLVINAHHLSRRKFMALTGWSDQQYLEGRLQARRQLAVLLDDEHFNRAADHDRALATHNKIYRAALAKVWPCSPPNVVRLADAPS
jgi:hypothetical protein